MPAAGMCDREVPDDTELAKPYGVVEKGVVEKNALYRCFDKLPAPEKALFDHRDKR